MAYENNASLVTRILDPSSHYDLVFDLGYRPSDLAQTNCIIWVEGPSDRIYLKDSIQRAAPDLIEGVNYSLMFYGGKLLSHLSADDLQLEKFIALTRLNRRAGILIDSDLKAANASINATKQRVIREFESRSLFQWVTQGSEIENYIEAYCMVDALKSLYPNAQLPTFDSLYSDRCVLKEGGDKEVKVDKVRLARTITKSIAPVYSGDWDTKISELIAFIRQSN